MTEHIGAVSFLLTLDRRQFDSDLQNLASTDRALPVGLKINPQEIREQLKQSRMPALKMGVELDSRGVEARLAKLGANRVLSLRVAVDDRRLYALNKHFDLKERHHRRLQRYFDSSPLTVRVNDAALVKLERVLVRLERARTAEVKVKVQGDIRSQLPANLSIPVVLKYQTPKQSAISQKVVADTGEFEKAITKAMQNGFKGAGKELRKTKLNLGSIVTAPLRMATGAIGGIGSTIASGLIYGATQQVSKNFGKGLSSALENAIGSQVGSSELFAEKVGGSIASSFVSGFKAEITAISSAVEQQIEKIKDPRKRRQAQEAFANIKAIPGQTQEAVTRTIGAGEIQRQDLLRKGVSTQSRQREDRTVNRQAETEVGRLQKQIAQASSDPNKSAEAAKMQAKSDRLSVFTVKPQGAGLKQAQAKALDNYRQADAKFVDLQQRGAKISANIDVQFNQALVGFTAKRKAFTEAQKAFNDFNAEFNKELNAIRAEIVEAGEQGRPDVALQLSKELEQLQSAPEIAKNFQQLAAAQDDAARPFQEALQQLNALTQQKKTIEAAISEAKLEADLARKKVDELTKSGTATPKDYTALARKVAGKNFDEARLPRLETNDEFLRQSGANAAYDRTRNVIYIKKSMEEALQKADLAESQLMTLAEELSHAYDLDFGSAQGLEARQRGDVLPDRKLKATPEEMARISPEVSRYAPDRRAVELNGKVRAGRAVSAFQKDKQQEKLLNVMGSVRQSVDVQPLIAQYNALFKLTEKLNGDASLLAQKQGAKLSQLIDDVESTIGAMGAGDLGGDALISEVVDLRSRMAELQGEIKTSGQQLVRAANVKALERDLDKDPFFTPAAAGGAVEDLIAVSASKTTGKAARFDDPWKSKEEIRQERIQRGLNKAKARASKVFQGAKEVIFNSDREIAIDMDKMRDRVEKTGIVLYQGGLAIAKTMDAANSALSALAQSNIGQSFLGGLGQATAAIGGVAKAGYTLAEGMESIALDLTPGGRMVKGALKQTAIPALAFGAATHFLPGGQMVAGAMGDFAQSALSPIGQSIAGNLSGGAVDLIGQAVPNVMGLQTQIAGAVSGAIEGAVSAATSGVAAAAVPILGGKMIQAAASRALPQMTLPQGRQSALPPSKTKEIAPTKSTQDAANLALPPSQRELRELTTKQLQAIAKQNKINHKGNKEQIASRLEQQLGYGKLDPIIANIDNVIDRKGKAVAGYDSEKEAGILKKFTDMEALVNEKIRSLQSATGEKRKNLLEELLHSTQYLVGEIEKTKTELLSGETAKALGQMQGRVETTYRYNPEAEAGKKQRSKQATESLKNQPTTIDVSATPVRDQEGLARVSDKGEGLARVGGGDQKPGLFRRLTDRVRSVLPLTEKRLIKIQSNYAGVIEEIHQFSGAITPFDKSVAPKLKIDDKALKEIGAEAYYDAEQNVILINRQLAAILERSPKELQLYADKLKALTHEGRHSVQTMNGSLDFDQAATGIATPLANDRLQDDAQLTDRQRRQVEDSANLYRGKAKRESVVKLESDAYAFEAHTPQILKNASTRLDAEMAALPKRPLNKLGRKLADIKDSIEMSVGNFIDSIKLTVKGQRDLIPQAKTSRYQKRTGKILQRDAEQSISTADAAANEAQYQQTMQQGREAQLAADDAMRQGRKIQRKTAKQLDVHDDSEHDIFLAQDLGENPIESYFGKVKSVLKGFNQSIGERLSKQAQDLAEHAKSTLTDLTTNRLEAEAEAPDNSAYQSRAEKLGELEGKTKNAIAGIEEINAKPNKTSQDRRKLRELQDEIKSVYRQIEKPLPEGSGGGLLELGDRIFGLVGKFKLLGAALLALPFALQGLQMLKQFAGDALQAAIAADKLNTSLNFTTRGKAKEAIAFADSEAERLGVSRSATIDGMARISAAGRGKISEADQRELMTGLSMAGTTFGMDREEMTGANNAVAQMLSKGKVQAEELRGQLGERLPGAFGIAAKSMGMSEEELNKQLELGNVSAKDFVPKFAKQLQAEFGAGAEEAGKNLQSSLIRLENAMERLKIASGSAIAPAFKVAVDAAAIGVNGLSKAMEVLGKIMPALVGTGAVMLIGKLGGLGAILGNLGKLAVGAVGNMGGFAGLGAKLLPALGVASKFLLKMLLVQGAIEAVSSTIQMFRPDEMGSRFEKMSNDIADNLKKIREEADKTSASVNQIGKTKSGDKSMGFDFTLGMGGMFGLENGYRSDDLITGINQKIGTKFGTVSEVQIREGNDRIMENAYQIQQTGAMVRDPKIRAELEKARAIDAKDEALAQQRAKLSAQPSAVNRDKIAQIDRERANLGNDRQGSTKSARELGKQIDQNVTNLREALQSNESDKNIGQGARDWRRAEIQGQLRDAERAQRQFRALESTTGSVADRVLQFKNALSELSAKLEDVSRNAENAFNAAEVGRLQKSSGRFKSDSEASMKDAEESASNQVRRAQSEFEGQQKLINEIQSKLQAPEVQKELNKIPIAGTNRTASVDSSLADLELAKTGLTDESQKDLIDKIINFRKAKDALPGLQKNTLEAQSQERETKQRNAFERMERKSQQRDLSTKTTETADAINLNNKIGLGQITDTQADIDRAKMSAKSARAQKANIDEQLATLEDYYQKGIVSAEEYEKRKRDLQLRGLDAVKQISDAELQVRQAANRKALDDFERSNRRRDLDLKKADAADAIAIAQAQIGNQISSEDIEIAKSNATLRSTEGEAGNLQAQANGLKSLRDQGVLDANQYADRMMEIEGRMVDLTVRQAEARLAAQQAANRKALEDFEQAARQRESINKRLQASEQIGLLDRRRTKDINSEDAAIEQQDVNLRATAREDLELSNKKRDLEIKYSSRLINRKDYDAQKRELTDQKTEIDTKRAEQNLSRQEAVDSKAINESSRQVQEQRMGAEMAFSQRTGSIRLLQAKTGILAGEGGQQALDKVEGENTRSRMAIIEQEMAANDELFANRNIDEIAYNQKSLELASQLQQEKAKLIDLEIKQREYAALAASDAAKRQTDGIIMQLDREKGAIDGVIKVIQDRQSLLSTQLELSRTSAEARTSQLEIRSGRATEAADLMAKLQDPSTGQSMRGLLQKQLGELGFGAADPAQALQGKLAIEQELAREKLTALQEQQGLERNILELKILQERSSAKSAEIEARKNAQLAQKAKLDADLSLAQARMSGDANQIANAESAAKIAGDGINLAAEQTKLAAESLSYKEQEFELQRRILGLKEGMDTSRLTAESAAKRRSGERELGEALAKVEAKNVTINNGVINNGAVTNNIKPEDKPKEAPKAWGKAWQEANKNWESAKFGGKDWDARFGGFDPSSVGGGGSGAAVSIGGGGGGIQANTVIGGQNTAPRFLPMGAGSAMDSPGNKIQVRYEPANFNNDELVRASNSMVPVDRSAQVDKNVMQAGSDRVVKAIDNLGGKVEKLANTPRSLSFSTPEPVNDYADFMNQQTRALG